MQKAKYTKTHVLNGKAIPPTSYELAKISVFYGLSATQHGQKLEQELTARKIYEGYKSIFSVGWTQENPCKAQQPTKPIL